MAYKMHSPEGTKRPRASAFYIPYSPHVYVLTILASIGIHNTLT